MKTIGKNRSGKTAKPGLPGQVVLVLQGVSALGAKQIGVYEALHEVDIKPDWFIGQTTITIGFA